MLRTTPRRPDRLPQPTRPPRNPDGSQPPQPPRLPQPPVPVLNLKRLVGWGGGQFDPFCGFSKNIFSKEREKPWFFATFNIIIKYIFPGNFIEIPRVVQKL